MAATGVYELTRYTALAAGDVLPAVDVSDTTQSAHGSLLSITITNFFASIPVPVVITSANAAALAVGLNGATNPAFKVDASTALQAAGLTVVGAATGGTVAVVVRDSGSNAHLSINAKGTGTIAIGSVSTGAVTITPALTLSNALTYGGVALSNAVTGTGNMVLSASPTITGTLAAQAVTATSLAVNGIATMNDGTTSFKIGNAAGQLRLAAAGTSFYFLNASDVGAPLTAGSLTTTGTGGIIAGGADGVGAVVKNAAADAVLYLSSILGWTGSGSANTAAIASKYGINFYTNNSVTASGTMTTGGVLAWGTTVTAGSVAGEIVLGNNLGLRGVNTAGGGTVALIYADGKGCVQLGSITSAAPAKVMYEANASLNSAGANANGVIGIDSTNNRLCYWSGGNRYYVTGTSF